MNETQPGKTNSFISRAFVLKRKKLTVNSKLFNICDLDGSKIKPYFESPNGFESVGIVYLKTVQTSLKGLGVCTRQGVLFDYHLASTK